MSSGLYLDAMKYCVLIIDGAAGWPLPDHGNKTCLELAHKPNLDAMAREGVIGMARTVPNGMEPSSACACMSVLGYDPQKYYGGRSGIEARSMNVTWGPGEVVFRCNLVAIRDGRMWNYSSGHITTEEARQLISALQANLASDEVQFFPGMSYRHLARITHHEDTLKAECTPPHDIPNQAVEPYLPKGPGSAFLRDLMDRSKKVLQDHPVNVARRKKGHIPATQAWLFWATGQMPEMPPFKQAYRLNAALTSAVDLLKGLAIMAGINVLEIPGVTDGPDNDYAGQAAGALDALEKNDLVVIHVETPDEAGHAGSVEEKVKALELTDREVVARLRSWRPGSLRILVTPDHPTPIKVQTHVAEPVPFLIWGPGVRAAGASSYCESSAKASGVCVDPGHALMGKFIAGWG